MIVKCAQLVFTYRFCNMKKANRGGGISKFESKTAQIISIMWKKEAKKAHL